MFDASTLRTFEQSLVDRAGGYLRNPVRQPSVTCAVCTTPVDGYLRCAPCNAHARTHRSGLADAVAALTYAVDRGQAAYVMRGYKATSAIREHVSVVTILTWLGIGLHTRCAGRLVNLPVTHWAAIPSLPAKPGRHPFHRIVAASQPASSEATLVPAPDVASPREVSPEHFTTPSTLPPGSHVLILDDTWARGGHAQSAALTFRYAGAEKVSIMVAARWVNRGFGDNERFIRERLTADYDPRTCPWTGGTCP